MNVGRIQTSGSASQVRRGHGDADAPLGGSSSFAEVLRSRSESGQPLRFSAHAQQRIEDGNVELGAEGMARLERAVTAADQKGSRDALVLMDDLAFLVSVNNRTVVTAIDPSRRKDGVFTNIDSVVMA